MVMTSSMTSQGGVKVGPICSRLESVGSVSKLLGQSLANTYDHRNRSKLYMTQEDFNK